MLDTDRGLRLVGPVDLLVIYADVESWKVVCPGLMCFVQVVILTDFVVVSRLLLVGCVISRVIGCLDEYLRRPGCISEFKTLNEPDISLNINFVFKHVRQGVICSVFCFV